MVLIVTARVSYFWLCATDVEYGELVKRKGAAELMSSCFTARCFCEGGEYNNRQKFTPSPPKKIESSNLEKLPATT